MSGRPSGVVGLLFLFAVAPACGTKEGAPSCKTDSECANAAATPLCDVAAAVCVALPKGHAIGFRDGSAGSVAFAKVGAFPAVMQPIDLGFHPDREELWVIGYGDDSVQVGNGVVSGTASWKRYRDPAHAHFMYRPTSMAMGAADTWATCGNGDNRQNATGDGSGTNFTGPTLFSSDLTVFATRPTDLGSHIDMLHGSPFCRGIAHVEANVYWVFNAFDRSLDKYNFNRDHGPGNDDHADGEIYRYALGMVKGADDGTPSHVFYDASDKFLYAADTGNHRIVRLDTTKGAPAGKLPRQHEPLKGEGIVPDSVLEQVVEPGLLESPSGLEVHEDLIYVTDAATGLFHLFDKSGTKIRSLSTGLPAGALAGFTFGPDGKIYFTDKSSAGVYRIDAR